MPIPHRKGNGVALPELELASWSEVEQHLAQYEQILQEEPGVREQVLVLVDLMRRYSKQLPGAMPPAVAEAFERLSA